MKYIFKVLEILNLIKDYDLVILSDNDFEKLDNFLEDAVMVGRTYYWNVQVLFRIHRMDILRYTLM